MSSLLKVRARVPEKRKPRVTYEAFDFRINQVASSDLPSESEDNNPEAHSEFIAPKQIKKIIPTMLD
jgi:hypothetical protein